MQELWIAAFRCFLEENKIQNYSTLLSQRPWLPVNCSEWDCGLTGSIKTNGLSHRRDKINQVFSQIKILQLEQALGSTDPPDKSERNSRQMWSGDKEEPIGNLEMGAEWHGSPPPHIFRVSRQIQFKVRKRCMCHG